MKNLQKIGYAAMVGLIFLLGGCGGYVYDTDLELATKLCEPNGGIEKFRIWNDHKLTCKNGAEFDRDEYHPAT